MNGDENRTDDALGARVVDDAEEAPRPKRRRILLWVGTPVVLLLLGVGGFIAKTVYDVNSSPYKTVAYSVPDAPTLVARPDESVFRIDPSKSSLSYEVSEKFAGRSLSKATGTTNGIAGDIAVNAKDPSASRAGVIVANIEQFHSDNRLRDARIRSDFLQSHAFPLAEFTVTSFEGLPASLAVGDTVTFEIEGKAKVHGVTHPVTWDAEGTLRDHGIDLTATAPIKLSDFDIDHVSIQGLVSASDDATMTMKLHAVDPATERIPETITGPNAKTSSAKGPSFSKVVMPILEDHCSECHKPGEVGAVHWELSDAQDVAEISEGIQTVTETGYMPPWPASDKGVPLAHKNTLTKAQVTAIADWAKAGGKLDVPGTTRIKPSAKVAQNIPRVDKKLLIPTYLGHSDMENEYRCFVLDPKLTKPMFLTGYGFVADQIPELHHAQVFLISGDQKKNALKMSGKDGKPGWSCFGTANVPGKPATSGFSKRRDVGFSGQSNLVAGWVPGQTPSSFGDNLGFYMDQDDALVLQIHYHHEGKATPDRSGLTLQLDPVTANRKKIRVVNPLAPVEIPCAPGVEAKLCDRDAAIEENKKLYGASGSFIENALLGLCGKTPEELTKDFDGQVAHTDCMATVPESGTILSVLGHMHVIGKSFRLTLDPGTPEAKVLLDLPVWNFDWQMNYDLAKPIHVEAGQKILMQCSFDRSLDPNRAPKYIMFADGTEDEMCFGTYALVPDNQSGS
jgi:polyisoprenoid-binding protein YceI